MRCTKCLGEGKTGVLFTECSMSICLFPEADKCPDTCYMENCSVECTECYGSGEIREDSLSSNDDFLGIPTYSQNSGLNKKEKLY